MAFIAVAKPVFLPASASYDRMPVFLFYYLKKHFRGEISMKQKIEKRSTLLVFISAILFSLGGLFMKMIPWSGLATNGARSLLSVIINYSFLRLSGHELKISKWILLGAALVFVTNSLFSVANKLTTAANAIVLQFTAPVFTVLLSWFLLRQKPKKSDIIACIAVLLGIVCFFLDSLSAGGMLGNAIALFTGLTYAGVFMMNSMPDSDPVSSVIIGQFLGAAVGIPFLLQETDFSFQPVMYAVLLGVFQMGLGYLCFSNGLRNTPPVTASLVSGIEPVLNPVWVAFFYGESLTTFSVIGGIIVIGSIIIYSVYKDRHTAELTV